MLSWFHGGLRASSPFPIWVGVKIFWEQKVSLTLVGQSNYSNRYIPIYLYAADSCAVSQELTPRSIPISSTTNLLLTAALYVFFNV